MGYQKQGQERRREGGQISTSHVVDVETESATTAFVSAPSLSEPRVARVSLCAGTRCTFQNLSS